MILINSDVVPKLPKRRRYRTIHDDDIDPVTAIAPDLEFGPWIAGGAALLWFQNRPVGASDIDVFCASEEQADNLIAIFTEQRTNCEMIYKTNNAVTFTYFTPPLPTMDTITAITHNICELTVPHTWCIQIIKKQYFDTAQAIIDKFDITVCQLVTDGNEYVVGETTVVDINQKNLRMTSIKADALKRYLKYMAYGYRPVAGLYKQIIENPDATWEFGNALDQAYGAL